LVSTVGNYSGAEIMPHTTQCIKCGVRLNVPLGAQGKRLKCPQCGTRFLPDGPNPNAASSAMRSGIADASLDSMMDVAAIRSNPDLPVVKGDPRKGGHGNADMPTSSGDLRETFDLPLLVDDSPTSQPTRAVGDAEALFQERPGPARRQGAAEARARARRCPDCGGVVQAGMSLCNTCGLNLETGQRVDLDEDLTPAPMHRNTGAPLGVSIIGGVGFLGSVILTLNSLIRSVKGQEGTGFLLLTLVCVFGVFASVQFLRGKSVKLMLIALSLGALVNVVALIVLPIMVAYSETTVVRREVTPDTDDEGLVIQSVTERLDMQPLTMGILGLVAYAAISVYLTSPPVRRHFAHRDVHR